MNICLVVLKTVFFRADQHVEQRMCLQHNMSLNPVFSVFAEEIGGGAFVSPSQESDFEDLATMLAARLRFGHPAGPLPRDLAATVLTGRSGKNARSALSLKQTPTESGEMSEEVLELGGKRCKFGAIEIWLLELLFV